MKINIRVRDSGNNEIVKTIDTEEGLMPGNDIAAEIFQLLHDDKTVIVEKVKEEVRS